MIHNKNLRSGFTLVELILVIAVIAIVSSLAISRLSGIKEKSANVVNMANLGRIGSAVETFVVASGGKLDRLDLPVLDKVMVDAASYGTFDTDTSNLLVLDRPTNIGLHENLYEAPTLYGATFPPLLLQYALNQDDVRALRKLGLKQLMRSHDGERATTGDDGEWATGSLDDPDTCLSISTTIEPGLTVTAINPSSISGSGGTIAPAGALVYQACGQDVRFLYTPPFAYSIKIGGTSFDLSDTSNSMKALKNNGGILLAFGLGQYASMIGSSEGGLDSAPTSPVMDSDTYRRYFILIRLTTKGTVYEGDHDEPGMTTAEFAGVMDPMGRTMKQLRDAAK